MMEVSWTVVGVHGKIVRNDFSKNMGQNGALTVLEREKQQDFKDILVWADRLE